MKTQRQKNPPPNMGKHFFNELRAFLHHGIEWFQLSTRLRVLENGNCV